MSPAVRRLADQAAGFLVGSGLGLAVDLSLFEVGVRLGARPWAANVVSAGVAVVVVYLFVTKYAFKAARSRSSFALFVGWYVTSIVVFSVLIELAVELTGWAPFLCKLLSLPPSFAANFLASKLLFDRQAASGPGGPVGSATVQDTADA